MSNLQPKPTLVYLTPEEAELFVEFQKRFAFINLLDSLKVFEIRTGSATINFDKDGQITSVEKREHFKVH